MIRRTEHANFTLEQVEGHVRDTLEVAAKCGLTDEERVALLPQIFDKLSSKQIVMEQYELGPNMVVAKGLG